MGVLLNIFDCPCVFLHKKVDVARSAILFFQFIQTVNDQVE